MGYHLSRRGWSTPIWDRTRWETPTRGQVVLGQVKARVVCLLQFPTRGLSCSILPLGLFLRQSLFISVSFKHIKKARPCSLEKNNYHALDLDMRKIMITFNLTSCQPAYNSRGLLDKEEMTKLETALQSDEGILKYHYSVADGAGRKVRSRLVPIR